MWCVSMFLCGGARFRRGVRSGDTEEAVAGYAGGRISISGNTKTSCHNFQSKTQLPSSHQSCSFLHSDCNPALWTQGDIDCEKKHCFPWESHLFTVVQFSYKFSNQMHASTGSKASKLDYIPPKSSQATETFPYKSRDLLVKSF